MTKRTTTLQKEEYEKEIQYPETDGLPMADSTEQYNWIVKIKEGFEILFKNNPNVFVAGNLFWYPVEGHPEIKNAPDILVVFCRPKGDRSSYKQWEEENKSIDFVCEIRSPSNTKIEMQDKLDFYNRYGVKEYCEYDFTKKVFRVWIRESLSLEEINFEFKWKSNLTNVVFDMSSGELEVYHPSGKRFESPLEIESRALREKSRADKEKKRANKEKKRADKLAEQLRELGIEPKVDLF